ncbi:MAG: DMT family transporter [Ignavibacteriales bacterium]|nr:DMT family transporter [Ignavibacteriales bacterium]
MFLLCDSFINAHSPIMTEHNKSIFLLLFTAILWSSGGVLIKLVDWNPIAIAGGRSAIAFIFIFLIRRKIKIELTFIKIAGGLAYAGTVILFVLSNKLTTAANAILLQFTAPIYVAIFGNWFLNEKMSRRDVVTIILVLCGMTLFFLDKLSTGNMIGNITAILSGVTFAWLVLLLRKQKKESPIESIVLGNAFTAVIGLPFMFSSTPSMEGWIGLLLLGVFQLGLSYILYTKAIKHVTAIEAILIPVLEPILNPIWALIFLSEKPGIWSVVGGGIVILSITFRSVGIILKRKIITS